MWIQYSYSNPVTNSYSKVKKLYIGPYRHIPLSVWSSWVPEKQSSLYTLVPNSQVFTSRLLVSSLCFLRPSWVAWASTARAWVGLLSTLSVFLWLLPLLLLSVHLSLSLTDRFLSDPGLHIIIIKSDQDDRSALFDRIQKPSVFIPRSYPHTNRFFRLLFFFFHLLLVPSPPPIEGITYLWL